MVSSWPLYIGVFLCATGVGIVIGAIFIFYWGIKVLESKRCDSYTENYTENNFTANIDHYHTGNDGSDDDDWRKTRRVNGTIGEGAKRDYVSKDTLEENR